MNAHRNWHHRVSGSRASRLASLVWVGLLLSVPAWAQSWNEHSYLHTARFSLGAVEHQGSVYAIGGFRGESSLEVLPFGSSTWVTLSPLPSPQGGVTAALAGDRIYAMGGYGPTDLCQVYDITTGRWSSGPRLPKPLYWSTAETVGSSIYLIGGYSPHDGGAQQAVYRLDPSTGIWSEVASLPVALQVPCSTTIGSRIYVFGRNAALVYDTRWDSWSWIPMPPSGHGSSSAAEAVNGEIHLLGGSSGSIYEAYSETEIFDPATSRWRAGRYLAVARQQFEAVYVPSRSTLFAVGGRDRTSAAVSMVEALPVLDDGVSRGNVVALFVNLDASDQPAGYRDTSFADALEMMDEGSDPADQRLTDFIRGYWSALSYGKLDYGVETPRDGQGRPLVPRVEAPGGATDWGGIIDRLMQQYSEEIWQAAGSRMKDGRRFIPCLALVQNYPTGASATTWPWMRNYGGHDYEIYGLTHIRYSLTFFEDTDAQVRGRRFWATLCHELGHNLLRTGDLYSPSGSTGYWDLNGDNLMPGVMSEVSSVFKEKLGWIDYTRVIEGPEAPQSGYTLLPYSTTGQAMKIVPDPVNNPKEYFVLEYRKSTGDELWRPDGALPEEGLLITHINDRMGLRSGLWLKREAPFFDPELADFSDRGKALWTGRDQLTGALFSQDGPSDRFTPYTQPNSDFYGGNFSGLSITQIQVSNGVCYFALEIDAQPQVGWTVGPNDRAVAGNFTPLSKTLGQEIFIQNDERAALIAQRDGHWFTLGTIPTQYRGWRFSSQDRHLVGDFDGDGWDEIYVRSHLYAGILDLNRSIIATGWIDGWRLGSDNWEEIADVDGDGRDEIIVRSPGWMGVIGLRDGALRLLKIEASSIGSWDFRAEDRIFTGRFSSSSRDDVILLGTNRLGLFRWNGSELVLQRMHSGSVGPWSVRSQDQLTVGDYDGDGRDEVYVHRAGGAALLEWTTDAFVVRWQTHTGLEDVSGRPEDVVELRADDRSYAGQFLPDREGVLHRASDQVGIVTWDGSKMSVRKRLGQSMNGRWAIGAGDRYVLGDFHGIGPDPALPHLDYVGDGLTDVFMHNSWGTGTFAVNVTAWNPQDRPWDVRDEIGLTWMQEGFLLRLR